MTTANVVRPKAQPLRPNSTTLAIQAQLRGHGEVVMSRLLKHLLHTPFATRRAFPAAVQESIRQVIHDGEQRHQGEIRFVVEGDWPLLEVWSGRSVRERALEVFGLTRVWDTAGNTGILIYVLLCEQKVEILVDRGFSSVLGPQVWYDYCDAMTSAFRAGRFEQGSLDLIRQIHSLLAVHFPSTGVNPNELPDVPVILR
ncbi:MAG: TPM domain-containing protein [Moraxellaceae bacterium]|nr:TPM domain-containing protein [Moraxellaceae bacterium]MBP7229952.1 TPM domain-containing protein [Moraxellaceae bacterium]MBP8852716.1 TPM domain-containing protein [Moraxellaceae bacterium]MBP9045719.1 TPM domain-containing protein [Moraxellaceae bacterium]